ncbi:PIN domain-containing protein [Flammeovirga aprica]|uniref:PIN domain-containing protein n=1 Tax=Flammeovirga aprica JL-4 TaxID=694437 RepID=A0A7X9XD90_9BACT|nr:PIN domain-containing protein [Flammeovirga aprica]NME72612.1 PIN domain-containing protein [Flammeovirga aprica JL-4]
MLNCVLDANILYPVLLRDLFLCLHNNDAIDAFWSSLIQDEWVRNVSQNRSEDREKFQKVADRMNTIFPTSCVSTELVNSRLKDIKMEKDRDDRHVVACAVESKSRYIVTYNIKDFPASEIEEWNVCAIHPDQFISQFVDKELLRISFHQQLKMYKNPPYSKEDLLELMVKRGLVETAKILR